MSNNKEVLVRATGVKQWFPIKKWFFEKQRYVKAVDGVDIEMYRGETLGVCGESGCGKSTLMRTMLQLLKPTEGSVTYEGHELTKIPAKQLKKIREHMQIVFQDPYSALDGRMRVGKIIEEPLLINKIYKTKEERLARVQELMKQVGLDASYIDRYPHEFSGGQRQRIVIARALSVNPKLVICDEPVSALDVSIQAQIINLLKKLQRERNLAYVFISHDLSVVKFISDKIGVMYLGGMMEFGSKEDIFTNPLHPYTKALFSAVPNPDPTQKMQRIALGGDNPSPANPPKGCRFHTRCPYAKEICKHVVPEYKEYGEGHFAACHLLEEQ